MQQPERSFQKNKSNYVTTLLKTLLSVISCCISNYTPQTWQLTTTNIHYLIISVDHEFKSGLARRSASVSHQVVVNVLAGTWPGLENRLSKWRTHMGWWEVSAMYIFLAGLLEYLQDIAAGFWQGKWSKSKQGGSHSVFLSPNFEHHTLSPPAHSSH